MADAKELQAQARALIEEIVGLGRAAADACAEAEAALGQRCTIEDCKGRANGEDGVMCMSCWEATHDEGGELEASRVLIAAVERWWDAPRGPTHDRAANELVAAYETFRERFRSAPVTSGPPNRSKGDDGG